MMTTISSFKCDFDGNSLKHCVTQRKCPMIDNIQSLMYEATLKHCPYFKANRMKHIVRMVIGRNKMSFYMEGKSYSFVWLHIHVKGSSTKCYSCYRFYL